MCPLFKVVKEALNTSESRVVFRDASEFRQVFEKRQPSRGLGEWNLFDKWYEVDGKGIIEDKAFLGEEIPE